MLSILLNKKEDIMTRYEKIAWFDLAVISVSIVLYLMLFLLLRIKFDVFMSAQIATSAFTVVALSAFGPIIFKKTGVVIDEQGTMIRQKHGLFKYLLFWAAYISIFIGIWIWTKITGTIANQVTVLLVFLNVTVVAMLAFILFRYFKMQKESRFATEDQNFTDVILFGPDMDERDLKIQKSARWCGFGVFWFFYVGGIMWTWVWLKYMGHRSISLDTSILPLFVFGAFMVIFTADTITRVILYRRGK